MAQGARSETVVPQPPRATGDAATDTRAIIEWAWTFFQAVVPQSGLLDPAYQADPSTFDAANPPDPTNSSIALAQATANEALSRVKALGG